MTEQAKINRLLRLMKILTSNVAYTLEDIAERLNTSPRTVYRYLESLTESGFVIQKVGKRTFQLCAESPFFKDISQLVHFSEEEAYMVNQLIESISDNNEVKRNLKKKLASVYQFKGVADSVIHKNMSNNVHLLLDAIEQKRQVALVNYSSSHTGSVSTRIVEPFAFTDNYIQLWCYEPKSGMNKMFRISRIEEVVLTENEWQYAVKHQSAYIDIFRMSSINGKTYPVTLELNRRARNLLVEEYLLAERDLKKIGYDCWLLQTQVSNYLGVGRFVLGLAADIRVIDSPGLTAYLKDYTLKNLNFE